MELNLMINPNDVVGYGVLGFDVAKGLKEAGAELALSFPQGDDIGRINQLVTTHGVEEEFKRHYIPGAKTMRIAPPNTYPFVNGSKVIGFTMLETDRVSKIFASLCNTMDAIINPTTWGAETFRFSGVEVPLYSWWPGIDTRLFRPGKAPYKSEKFTFGALGRFQHRKGYDLLIRAFVEEFAPDEPVALRCSWFNQPLPGKPDSGYFHRDCGFERLLELGLDITKHDIQFVDYHKNRGAIRNFYLSNDVFVCPSRGEGFGYPPLEAMACGVPTITTKWGALEEIIPPDVGYKIDIEDALVPVYNEIGGLKDSYWAEPKLSSLRRCMRRAFNERDDKLKEYSKRGISYINKKMSVWKNAPSLLEVLEGI